MKPATILTPLALVLMAFTLLPAAAQDAPFIGVVTKDKVEVRSGAGRAYYVVGELEKDAMVRVEKVLFNQTWYQIRVPEGVYSYISKAFVDAQGDGETGTVNANRTEFKAASRRSPGDSYRVQGTLNKGDTVTILGEEGTFYKIVSPEDAFVFIPAGSLRVATADDLQAAGEAPTQPADTDTPETDTTDEPQGNTPPTEPVEPVQPVEPIEPNYPEPADTTPEPTNPEPAETTDEPNEAQTPTQPEPTDTTPDDTENTTPQPPDEGWPAAPEVNVETPARSDALKALELKVLPYFSLPIDEQPLDLMAAAYQDLSADSLPSIDKQIIEIRLRLIERRQQIANTMQRAEQARKESQARTVVPDEADTPPLPERYTAVGILMPSTVYDGGSLPLLYRIVDASPSARTLAYVAPSDKLNAGAMLNQLVGIVGTTQYDRALKLNVIEIERAIALQPESETEDAEVAEEQPAE